MRLDLNLLAHDVNLKAQLKLLLLRFTTTIVLSIMMAVACNLNYASESDKETGADVSDMVAV